MRSLTPFLFLIRKEWRDVRAVTLVCVALVPAALLALELGFLDWRGDFAGSTFVPVVSLLFLAIVTADLVAADVTSGRARVYAALPVRPRTLWAAKLTFVLLAGAAFAIWTTAITTGIYAAWAPPAQYAVLLGELGRLPLIGIAGGTCVIAATLAWSTVLERGLAAVGAGIVTFALIAGVLPVLGMLDPELIPTKEFVERAFLALPLLFLTASFVAFIRGPIHASSLPRRATLVSAVILGALVPTGAVWASVIADRLDVQPGDPDVRTHLVSVSPDREHAVLFASKDHARAMHRTWIVRLADGHVVALPGKGPRLDWTAPWAGGKGTLRVWSDTEKESVRHEIDADTGTVLRTRSRDQIVASGQDPWSMCPWATFEQRGTSTHVRFHDGTEPVVLPAVIHALALADRAWRRIGKTLVLYDVRSGETASVDLPLPPTGVHASPGGRYLRAWKGKRTWVVDTVTGRIAHDGPGHVMWPGGGSDDHFCLTWSGSRVSSLLDLRTGAAADLPNCFGERAWTEIRVLDADTWLTVASGNVLTLVRREDHTTRTIYDPNARTDDQFGERRAN